MHFLEIPEKEKKFLGWPWFNFRKLEPHTNRGQVRSGQGASSVYQIWNTSCSGTILGVQDESEAMVETKLAMLMDFDFFFFYPRPRRHWSLRTSPKFTKQPNATTFLALTPADAIRKIHVLKLHSSFRSPPPIKITLFTLILYRKWSL